MNVLMNILILRFKEAVILIRKKKEEEHLGFEKEISSN